MKKVQKVIDAYNDFDGQAMITTDKVGKIGCTVGQNECFVDGYRVIIAKSCKDDESLYLTYDELVDLL